MFCPACNHFMNNVMHFETTKFYQFNKCPNCYKETKPKRLSLEKFDRNENSLSIKKENDSEKTVKQKIVRKGYK